MPDPFRLRRKLRLARPPRARAQAPSRPSSESRAQSPHLPKPQLRAQSAPRPNLGLGARLPAHDGRTLDVTRTMPPTLQQGMKTVVSTTPVTVEPYLFHCGTLPYSKRSIGRVNPCHYDHILAVIVLLLQDMLQYHLHNHHDSNRARQPSTGMTTPSSRTPRMRWPISIGPTLSLPYSPEIIHNLTHVKALPPLAAIKGEAGHLPKTRQHTQITSDTLHHHIQVVHSTPFSPQSRDLGPSPLSQLACTSLLQALSGARHYRLRPSHWT